MQVDVQHSPNGPETVIISLYSYYNPWSQNNPLLLTQDSPLSQKSPTHSH